MRKAGYSVLVLLRCGHPGAQDLAVADQTGRVAWLEIKQPGRYPTAAQRRFAASWLVRVYVVHSVEEALEACKSALGGQEDQAAKTD